jgi:hypothetical protein
VKKIVLPIAALGLLVTAVGAKAMGSGPLDDVVPVDCAGTAPQAQPGTLE